MAKLVKLVLVLAAAIVGIGVIGAVALMLFFDPNDYRDRISTLVYETTGRELSIEGDISVTVFPWLALDMGRTTLGNAEGFGDDPFASFDSARLSVQFLPLVLRQEVQVGTAALEGFEANLAISESGTSNWADLAERPASADEAPSDETSVQRAFDIESIRLVDADISYRDDQAGSRYALSGVNVTTGRIALGERFDVDGDLNFSAMPAELEGSLRLSAGILISDGFEEILVDNLSLESMIDGIVSQPAEIRFDSRAITIDTRNEEIRLGELDLAALGLNVTANVQPMNYGGTPTIKAQIRVADFSLTDLLMRLDIEPPVTADANALQRLSFEAAATVGEDTLALDGMTLVMDDSTLTGNLAVPLTENGTLAFDLRADSITVDNYMAPAVEEDSAADEGGDVEIPVELIRALKARGSLRLDEAFVGPVQFTGMDLGVNSSDGRLRLYPISARFFDGSYAGDVRIDASGETPTLSMNEFINDVSIQKMLSAMYDVTDVTGTVNANMALTGAGQAMSAIAADLDGTMKFELLDGAWQGVDVWQQLRTARALYKREAPPEPRLPARTEFTAITASGVVTDGVFRNEDLVAQLPFLRVTGNGTVDLGTRELDYSVQARILETPEFMSTASEDELNDFTEALIPIRIRGPLASPSFRPDIEGMFRQEVERAIDNKKNELQNELMDRLLGGEREEEAAGETADTAPEEEKDLEDELKDRLRELFPR